MSKKTQQERIEHSKKYIEFLERRVGSKNYKANVSKEEYEKTQEKLKKERLVLKMLSN